jgi:cobalt-precorrin 5A hydrolase
MIVAGVGLRRDCAAEHIVAVVRRAAVLAGREPAVLAAPVFKGHEAGLLQAARDLGLPLILVERDALEAAQSDCVTRSAVALGAVGVASVAEGAALSAAGPGGVLLLPRIAHLGATCALAAA